MKLFYDTLQCGLIWCPEIGMGYYPVSVADRPYDGNYFGRYQDMSHTEMGERLTQRRIDFVGRHYQGHLVDVGIGAGQFVAARPMTSGFDVNPYGKAWLTERDLWVDLYSGTFTALSFWDSLEHIDRPDLALACAEKWVFVSLPIFDDGDHILRSRHFRRDEHIWYWTHDGLINWFDSQGFRMVEHNRMETELGREGIGSYAFLRATEI